MFAHGVYIEPRHIVAVVFGIAGVVIGWSSVTRGVQGRRGALARGCVAVGCSMLVLGVPLAGYYIELSGYGDGDLGGYDEPSVALETVLIDDNYAYWCMPAGILGLLGMAAHGIRRTMHRSRGPAQLHNAADDASRRS